MYEYLMILYSQQENTDALYLLFCSVFIYLVIIFVILVI